MATSDPAAVPGPGEEPNAGPPTVPRPSASVIVLRDGPEGPEVVLLERNPASRFMGGAWVFPGGAVDRDEGAGDRALRAAAVREVQEEAGVALPDPDALVAFSRWITPAQVKVRFDTTFFVAPLPPGARVRPDGHECVAARWLTPRSALQAGERGELLLVFPTVKHLEQLVGYGSVDDLLQEARRRRVQPVEPRLISVGGVAQVLLPGQAGYDEA